MPVDDPDLSLEDASRPGRLAPRHERGRMGEKGNITSAELASGAGGVGAVVAGVGTQVTAVFAEAGDTLMDKVIDKGADAGIAGAQEKWQSRKDDNADPASPQE